MTNLKSSQKFSLTKFSDITYGHHYLYENLQQFKINKVLTKLTETLKVPFGKNYPYGISTYIFWVLPINIFFRIYAYS